jgi:ATP-binding cassette, subfamily B (MDR/TAP), member 1
VLKKAAFKTTVSMEMAEIDKRGRPSLVHLVNISAEQAKMLASQTISSFVDVSATLIIGLTIAVIYCWQITLVALLFIPLIVVAGMLQSKFLTTLSENSDKILKDTHEMVIESIVNSRTVASLNLQAHYYSNYELRQDEGMKVTYRNSIFSGLTMALSQCLIAFIICLIYFIAATIC